MSGVEKPFSEEDELANLAEAESALENLANIFNLNSSETPTEIGEFFEPGQISVKPVKDLPKLDQIYRTLVEQIPAVVFMAFLDSRASEAYVSPHIEKMLGFLQDEWLEDPVRWYKHIHPDDKLRWSVEAAQMLVFGKPLRSTYRVIARDGHVVWFQCEAKTVLTSDGRPWYIHGVAFDVTDLKQTEQELRQIHLELEDRVQERTKELERINEVLQQEIAERRRAQEALAQQAEELSVSNSELEQFAYVASHDLQEPLRTVASYTKLLEKRYKSRLDEDADDFIQYIVDGAIRMQKLIDALLTYSRIGRKDKQFLPVDFTSVINSVCANLETAIEESHTEIKVDVQATVMGDEVQLAQLLQNLISNALKFRSSEPIRLEIGSKQQGQEWLFWVRDNGIGIEPQYAERIFMIFQRLHTDSDYPGTGIGLAVCKKIIERHNGRIWVKSELGKGSTFYFTLPVSKTGKE